MLFGRSIVNWILWIFVVVCVLTVLSLLIAVGVIWGGWFRGGPVA